MKKQYLAVAFLAVALGITACSSKKADTESTTAQEVESTEATSDEEVEEDYYYGFVSLVEDNVITVSEDGGNTAKFDISYCIIPCSSRYSHIKRYISAVSSSEGNGNLSLIRKNGVFSSILRM